MRIYLTHCSAKKDDSLKETGEAVTPDRLYRAPYIRQFMERCKSENLNWAIFSDLYGVWFPDVRHCWYDKAPNTVTPAEFQLLVADFDEKLDPYAEIWFYHLADRPLHQLYARLLDRTRLSDRVKRFTNPLEIVRG